MGVVVCQFQVTDNISVTPAIYYLSRPYGDLTNGRGNVLMVAKQ